MQELSDMLVLKRITKIILFLVCIFSLLFCITWQNLHMYLLKRKLEELLRIRNNLEKQIYMKNVELLGLKSRDRIRNIAVNELGMVPVTYRDIKVIIY